MLILATLLYFLPTIIALVRGHLSGLAIFLLNLFLGWTLIGWLIALIWSCTSNTAANLYRRDPTIIDPSGRVLDRRSSGGLWILLILIVVAIAIVDKQRHFRDLRSIEDPFPTENGTRL
ncbi:MAG TPA: superinfection immunity protein [Roseiarcus sp.]|nr:superinfection immunity protein [Roseiarcus sp.]